MFDENGQIINTEAGGLIFNGFPQTIYDREIFDMVDPLEEHALEKMVSGAYMGLILRKYLKELHDRQFLCRVMRWSTF